MDVAESRSLSEEDYEKEKAFGRMLYDNFEEKTANVTVYGFAGTTRLIVPFEASFEEGKDLLSDADGQRFGTNIFLAVQTCDTALQPLDDGRQKLIVLMTDGDDQSGNSNEELVDASATLKAQGVTISTVGIANSTSTYCPCEYDEELLRAMSSKKQNGEDLFYCKISVRFTVQPHVFFRRSLI